MKNIRPTAREQQFIDQTLEGRYIVNTLLARGGMGSVFTGLDTALDRKVAIKLLQTTLEEEAYSRFEREAQVIASFDQANLVKLYSHGTHEGFTYLVLEFVPGRSLADILAQGRLSIEATIELGICICAGLIEAHRVGVIHRDLKPGNILVEQKGEYVNAKLVDFGVAFALSDGPRLTTAGSICGTPGYIAPEQIAGVDISPKCDLYSLGIVLFEALTGKRAFDGTNAIAILLKQTQSAPPSLKNYQSLETPAKLERLIAMLVRKEPEDRPDDAAQVHATLSDIKETMAFDSDLHRQTVPLKAISRKDIERSLGFPIREGGGWEQLLSSEPEAENESSIDPQLYDLNPNMIDISFEFGTLDTQSLLGGVKTNPKVEPKTSPKPSQIPDRLGQPPIVRRDFSNLELEVIEKEEPVLKVRATPFYKKSWFQFSAVMFLSMAITLVLFYFFLESDPIGESNREIKAKSHKNDGESRRNWKRMDGL